MERVVFVTGASSGFGAGLARRFARRGWAVALAARRRDRLEGLVREIEAAGGRALACPCDVGDRAQLHAAVEGAVAGLGPVELLIANAGISWRTYPDTLDAAQVEQVMRVNFLGAVYAVEAVLPSMLERDSGQLVAVGSLAGFGGLPSTGAYSASKAALAAFFESLRLDLRPTGVDVTVLTPGYVKTELTERNAFPMPFLMELEPALDRMEAAILARRRRVGFPWPLWIPAHLGQLLPRWLYDRLASGVQRAERTPPAGTPG